MTQTTHPDSVDRACGLGTNMTLSVERKIRVDDEWDRLARQSGSGSIFLTSPWLSSWAATLGKSNELLVLRVFAEDVLVAAAAFSQDQGVIEFAGKGPTDYSDILISNSLADADALQAIQLLLRRAIEETRSFRAFKLIRIPPTSRTLVLLKRSGLYCEIEPQIEAPRMDMSAADEALRKKSLRRHARGLEKRGAVTCTTSTHASEILPKLEEFFELHIARWANTDTASAFLAQEQRQFYDTLVRSLDQSGWMRYTEVRLDDSLVAAHFGFMVDGCFTWYKPCFDPGLAKLSPGEVLIKRLIELALEEDADVFDFTIGAEAFKLRFATEVPMVMRAYVTNSAMRFQTRVGLRKLKRLTTRQANSQ